MSAQSRSSKTRRRGFPALVSAALILAALFTFAGLAAYARGWLTPRPTAASASAQAQDDPQLGRRVRSPLEVELITVTPRGIEPSALTRPAGKFLMVVENQTDLPEVTFRIERENAGRLHEVRLPRGKPDWSGEVDLQPGTYVVTEANHPDWACRVAITP